MKEFLTNFSKGELGPELQGRIDAPQYKAGAREVRNFVIQKYGGLSFRPGFRFVGPADDVGTPMRYFPFDYGLDQSYVLAAANLSFRPMALGGMVVEDNLKILGVTSEAQAILHIAYHDYVAGGVIFLDGVTGMTELNGRFATVVGVIDEHHVRVNVDTTGFAPFVSSDGTERTSAPTPPPAPPAPPAPPPAPPEPPAVGGGGGVGGGWGGGLVDEV